MSSLELHDASMVGAGLSAQLCADKMREDTAGALTAGNCQQLLMTSCSPRDLQF